MSSGVDYVVYAGAGSPGLRLRRVKLLIAKCLPLRAPFQRGWCWRWFLSAAVFRRLFHGEPSKGRRSRAFDRCYTMIVHDVSLLCQVGVTEGHNLFNIVVRGRKAIRD